MCLTSWRRPRWCPKYAELMGCRYWRRAGWAIQSHLSSWFHSGVNLSCLITQIFSLPIFKLSRPRPQPVFGCLRTPKKPAYLIFSQPLELNFLRLTSSCPTAILADFEGPIGSSVKRGFGKLVVPGMASDVPAASGVEEWLSSRAFCCGVRCVDDAIPTSQRARTGAGRQDITHYILANIAGHTWGISRLYP